MFLKIFKNLLTASFIVLMVLTPHLKAAASAANRKLSSQPSKGSGARKAKKIKKSTSPSTKLNSKTAQTSQKKNPSIKNSTQSKSFKRTKSSSLPADKALKKNNAERLEIQKFGKKLQKNEVSPSLKNNAVSSAKEDLIKVSRLTISKGRSEKE